MQEAIGNAEKTARQFAENSHSQLNKIVNADQGVFSIDDRDENTPWIKKVRVVTTVTYSLKDRWSEMVRHHSAKRYRGAALHESHPLIKKNY